MILGKVMICISRNQLAKELFSILEVFYGILYHPAILKKIHV